MESLEPDEEEDQMEFWNNWLPPSADKLHEHKYGSCGKRVSKTREVLFSFSTMSSINSVVENYEFRNWIPPFNFVNVTVKGTQNPTLKTIKRQLLKEKNSEKSLNANENNDAPEKFQGVTEGRTKASFYTAAYKKEVNLDWGKRNQLHADTKFSGGGLFWEVVHLGTFGSIKLWVNEYGNMCCLACGKISKLGSSEITFISITQIELLRKMLNVSSHQWASLCEDVKETKTILKFDAFEDNDLTEKTSLERLWFFICKRRHFLPRQCMLLKFNGVVKCLRKFEIRPKLLVEDIRNILGEPIM